MEVKELTNLKCLRLSGNQFSIFPKEIFLLESLERLHLGQNKGIKFTSLPEDISKLQVGAIEGRRSWSAALLWTSAAPKCRAEGSPNLFKYVVQHQARAVRKNIETQWLKLTLSLCLVVIPMVSLFINIPSALTDILCTLMMHQPKGKSFHY